MRGRAGSRERVSIELEEAVRAGATGRHDLDHRGVGRNGRPTAADSLGTESFATHRLPLEEAPKAYEIFQRKQDGAIKVLLRP
jgi:threonine dehydrogenase-like Zn-dependent dehydrogenase